MKSRQNSILACFLLTAGFMLLLTFYGYINTWKLWNVNTMIPYFADLRTITHGADSVANGLDPMVNNPHDPWQRRLNYPRIWQSLYSIGINKSHTIYIGIIFILSFLVGICLILPNASNHMVAIVMAAALSPAAILGIERGNADLFMFFLVSIAIVLARKRQALTFIHIILAFLLKLFPVFAAVIFVSMKKKQCLLYTFLLLVFGITYTIITYNDLVLITQATPNMSNIGYGSSILSTLTARLNETNRHIETVISYVAVAAAFALAISAFWRDDFEEPQNEQGNSKGKTTYLDAFRAGAAIYAGTFLLGHNFIYRLIFLIMTIPQLLLWLKHNSRDVALISLITLLSVFLSLFGTFSVVIALPTWVAFFGVLYLLSWSLPDWIKQYLRK